jgi:putative membrane protein
MSELNDPRVLFAAERTLLAWNRTSLALMAFGFVIERFGLFVALFMSQHDHVPQRGISFWTGLVFVLLGAWAALHSSLQYHKVLKTLNTNEFPAGYRAYPGVFINLAVAFLGLALIVYFFQGV